ncbi:hypothetical protein ACGFS9_30375 [Streptomyces sp. NPDC048566]|uniref:hypothetical protein n=1 Tax=Streptomyces sp. NPDC048566 TaxID=3365569 RepID=UPI003717C1F0
MTIAQTPHDDRSAPSPVEYVARRGMAPTAQLYEVLRTHRSRQSMSRQLDTLRRENLAVPPSPHRSRVRCVTPTTAQPTRGWSALHDQPSHPIVSGAAASLKALHTLTAFRQTRSLSRRPPTATTTPPPTASIVNSIALGVFVEVDGLSMGRGELPGRTAIRSPRASCWL